MRILTVSDIAPGGYFDLQRPAAFRRRVDETRFKQEWRVPYWQYVILQLGWNGEGDPIAWLHNAMRSFRGPRYQRGSIQMGAAGAAAASSGGASGSVVLTPHTDNFFGIAPDTRTCGFRFLNNGTLGRIEDANISGQWWSLEPVTSIGASYEVRALSAGKSGTWDTSGAADNVWVTMNITRTWDITSSGIRTTSATFEVGPDGVESADDSATLTALVSIEP